MGFRAYSTTSPWHRPQGEKCFRQHRTLPLIPLWVQCLWSHCLTAVLHSPVVLPSGCRSACARAVFDHVCVRAHACAGMCCRLVAAVKPRVQPEGSSSMLTAPMLNLPTFCLFAWAESSFIGPPTQGGHCSTTNQAARTHCASQGGHVQQEVPMKHPAMGQGVGLGSRECWRK